jgi:hypothetical protein
LKSYQENALNPGEHLRRESERRAQTTLGAQLNRLNAGIFL